MQAISPIATPAIIRLPRVRASTGDLVIPGSVPVTDLGEIDLLVGVQLFELEAADPLRPWGSRSPGDDLAGIAVQRDPGGGGGVDDGRGQRPAARALQRADQDPEELASDGERG